MDIKKYVNDALDDLDGYSNRIYDLVLDLNSLCSKLAERVDKYGDSNEYDAETYDKAEDLVTIVDQASKMLDMAFNVLYREVKHYRK